MRKSPKKQKYYLVLSRYKNYKHGAFPHSPEGLELAEAFVEKHKDTEDLYIVEK
jgi:hypothetical protein